MENDRIAKRVYVGECAGGRLVVRPQKRWIDTVKGCVRKRSLDVGQVRRMVGICEGECVGCCLGDEHFTLLRSYSCALPWLYEALEGWKSVCGLAQS